MNNEEFHAKTQRARRRIKEEDLPRSFTEVTRSCTEELRK